MKPENLYELTEALRILKREELMETENLRRQLDTIQHRYTAQRYDMIRDFFATHPKDMWSYLHLFEPEKFPSSKRFEREFAFGYGQEGYSVNWERLINVLKFPLKWTKEFVERNNAN